MPKALIKIINTFFYVGYLPLIPGTFGSLAGLFVFFLVKDSNPLYIFVTAILLVLGFLCSGRQEEMMRRNDPPCVVIDEVCGMLLSLLFLPYDIKVVILAFLIFRVLDTLKPYPAGWLEKLKGGLGIMSDDIIAGLYTNLIFQVVLRFVPFRTS